MKTLSLVLAGLFCAQLLATPLASRDTYQYIIDSKPFGELAKVVDTRSEAVRAEEQKKKEEIAQKFRMYGITDMPDGTRKVGFLDETDGTMQDYFLAVGESANGFTLLSADYDREHATLQKDGLTFTLGLGQGLIDTPEAPSEGAASETPPPVRKIEMRAASTETPPAPPTRRGSAKARLLKRQAAKAEAEQAKAEALQAEMTRQLEAKKRREEIERIKQGLPPTQPITLTPEEDAELEAAGVFNQPKEEAPAEPFDGNQPLLNAIEP